MTPGRRRLLTDIRTIVELIAAAGRYRLTSLRQAGTPADTLSATIGNRTFEADPMDRRFEVIVPVTG